MTIAKDLVGQRFFRLVVVELAGIRPHNRERIWRCRCDCGAITETRHTLLTGLKTGSCGCYAREASSARLSENTEHGHARRGATTPEYRSWRSMLDRCENSNVPRYSEYGGRGICVCDQWHSFEAFLADMGPRPEGTSLDRFPDVNGNYEPSNCRWATAAEQMRNTRRNIIVEFSGEKMCLKDACAAADINYTAALKRVKKGRNWNWKVAA